MEQEPDLTTTPAAAAEPLTPTAAKRKAAAKARAQTTARPKAKAKAAPAFSGSLSDGESEPEPEPEPEPDAAAEPAEHVEPLGGVEPEPEPEPERPPTYRRKRGRPAKSGPTLEDRLYAALGHYDTLQGTSVITGAAGFVAMLDPFDGACIAQNSAQVAHAYAVLAEENPRVRRLLEAALSGGAWGGAIIATLSMTLPILIHHGIVPGSLLAGTPLAQPASNDGAES